MTIRDLAKLHGLDKREVKSLDARLRRWRRKHFDGVWKEVTNRRGREPRYIYDHDAVRPVVKAVKSRRSNAGRTLARWAPGLSWTNGEHHDTRRTI